MSDALPVIAPSSKPTVLVTGDIVLDCHLYGGVKTAATSFSEPGTVYERHVGGAALTCRLLHAAADVDGREYDADLNKWEKDNGARLMGGKTPLARPEELANTRPLPMFESHLAFETAGLDLPKHLCSYGVWTDRPVKKGSKERVWRVERHFGYGPTQNVSPDAVFRPNRSRTTHPTLTLIDDGGILFRHGTSRDIWPDFIANADRRYLLKMSWPLCRGDLWDALALVMDRLTLVVSADDLRREDVQISERLSWEQCTENTLSALQNNSTARELLRAADVIVNFGSAGALWVHRPTEGPSLTRLLFDPIRLEGDYESDMEGTAYGFQTCVTVGIAYHLMANHARAGTQADGTTLLSPFSDFATMERAMQEGIAAGLTSHRLLLELGHGPINGGKPGFPLDALGQSIATSPGGFVMVPVPPDVGQSISRQWTILAQYELADPAAVVPLTGLAQLTARYGVSGQHGLSALSHVPALRLGRLFTVDRSEIESLRTLQALIKGYEATKAPKAPLSIGVFGPPGAGKSFGVKALAESILGDKVPFIEFNLSQFKNPEELIGALHRVRDAVLKGVTPVAFWDEFDSRRYKWLQYLLAPMQDGAFQEGQITHPIGKCIFIFAGGTSSTIEAFGVAEPPKLASEDIARLSSEDRADRQRHEDDYQNFKLLKGPDFVSRLHGFLNVLGPNENNSAKGPDITWPIRRALLLRGLLGLEEIQELDIDPGLLHALLSASTYVHGVRSFEKIITPLMLGRL